MWFWECQNLAELLLHTYLSVTTPVKYCTVRSQARTVPLSKAGRAKHRAFQHIFPASCAVWSHNTGPPVPHEQYFVAKLNQSIFLKILCPPSDSPPQQNKKNEDYGSQLWTLTPKRGEGDGATVLKGLDLWRRIRRWASCQIADTETFSSEKHT